MPSHGLQGKPLPGNRWHSGPGGTGHFRRRYRLRYLSARLPFGPAQHGPTRGAQAAVIVGDDIFHPAQATRLQALQKGAPVDLGLGQGHRDAQHPAPRVRADTDDRKHGGITNHAADAHLLVTGIEKEIADLPEGAISARASSSSSGSLVARPTCEDDRLSMPNWRITASASRVKTPLIAARQGAREGDISATASITARDPGGGRAPAIAGRRAHSHARRSWAPAP